MTVTVDDGGGVTITGDPAVVPTHTLVGRHTVSFTADPETWLAQVGVSPAVLFVIPVVVARTGVRLADPHQAARDANTTRAEVLRVDEELVLPAPREPEYRRPRQQWRSRPKPRPTTAG